MLSRRIRSMAPANTNNIVKQLLFDPISTGADRLCIISYQATPSMASWLLKTFEEYGISDITVELIIGSTIKEGIDNISHDGFKELQGDRYSKIYKNFTCSYLYQGSIPKTNLFIWLKDNVPICAYSGSYEFTQASLLRKCDNTLISCKPVDAYKKYEAAVNRSIFCNHAEVEDYVIVRLQSNSPVLFQSNFDDHVIHLSFLTRTGEVGKRSGLNWGQRQGRNKNEAYIPLPINIATSGFFPLNKQHFLVVTDDHHTLLLRVEQQNDKAITTPASNALLGEYFRNRLELPNGAYVHTSDLINYGRTDVSFIKIDDEQYYMDFSINTES